MLDDALRHLDAVGTGPKLRAKMAERSVILDALGISRATVYRKLGPPKG